MPSDISEVTSSPKRQMSKEHWLLLRKQPSRAAQAALLAVLLLWMQDLPTIAAEVECELTNSYSTIPDEIARDWWPSGFRPANEMCSYGYLHGTIEIGDYDKVETFYRTNHRVMFGLAIQSPGGNVAEAIKIGRLLRKYLIRADAPSPSPFAKDNGRLGLGDASGRLLCKGEGCECSSACALIWFGAPDRFGTVGLHRPRVTDPEFKSLAPSEAAKVYRHALDEIARYLDEMETPRPMIDVLLATGSSEIKWVDAAKDKLERAPSFAEWLDASCGHLTQDESRTLAHFEVKNTFKQPLTSEEAMLYHLLINKDGARSKCEISTVHAQVDRLSPPP
jgi:hypothetical protein